MNENYKKLNKLPKFRYGSFCSNYRNSKFRNEIKKRVLAELGTNNLPAHRKWECEGILSDIQTWETWEKREKLKELNK